MLGSIWNTIILGPVLNFLVYFSIEAGSIAWGVVGLVILIKLLTLPITIHRIRDTHKLAKMRPELRKLQKKYKNKEKLKAAKEKLYKKYNYHPSKGIIATIILFPILIALYQSVRLLSGEITKIPHLYPYVQELLRKHTSISTSFLGIDMLSSPDFRFLVFLFVIVFLNYYVNFLVFGKKRLTPDNFKDMAKNLGGEQNQVLTAESMVQMMKVMNFVSFTFNSLFLTYVMSKLPTLLGFYIVVQYITNIVVFGILYLLDRYVDPRILGDVRKYGE